MAAVVSSSAALNASRLPTSVTMVGSAFHTLMVREQKENL